MKFGFPLIFGLTLITILGLGGTPLPQSRCPAILFCRGKVGANSLGHAGNDGHHPTKLDHAGILKSQVVNAWVWSTYWGVQEYACNNCCDFADSTSASANSPTPSQTAAETP